VHSFSFSFFPKTPQKSMNRISGRKKKGPQTTRLHRIKELKQQSIENPNQLDIQAICSIQIQTIRGEKTKNLYPRKV
jgi:hypothetical protein